MDLQKILFRGKKMKLDLKDRLSVEEQTELKRRLSAVMNEMYLDGISAGRELHREPLHEDTEKFIQERLLKLCEFFLEEETWKHFELPDYPQNDEIPPEEDSEEDGTGCCGFKD